MSRRYIRLIIGVLVITLSVAYLVYEASTIRSKDDWIPDPTQMALIPLSFLGIGVGLIGLGVEAALQVRQWIGRKHPE